MRVVYFWLGLIVLALCCFNSKGEAQTVIKITGSNASGQLGTGGTTDLNRAGQVSTISDAISVAAGYDHSLAVRADGTVWAWGKNSDGQLGLGDTTNRNTPTQVPNLKQVVAVVAGGAHSLALKSDGTVWAWGNNDWGQLGDGTQVKRLSPVRVLNLVGIKKMAAGWLHSVFLKTNGTVWGCGQSSFGRLGVGNDGNVLHSLVVQARGLANVVDIGCGDQHTLAIKADGTLWTYGLNSSGQLGVGDTTERYLPTQVPGLTNVKGATGGFYFSIALRANGEVWGWGRDGYSEIGDGNATDQHLPVPSLITDATAIAAGYHSGFCIRRGGEVWGWGWNFSGELGCGNNQLQNFPVVMYGITGAGTVSSGNGQTMTIGTAPGWPTYRSKFDLNGDNKTDLLLQNNVTGAVYYWLLDGTNLSLNNYVFNGNLALWKAVGTPDLNSDGHPDLLLQNKLTGGVYRWILGGTNGTQIIAQGDLWTGGDKNWEVIGTPDLNGDGQPDVLLRHAVTGQIYYWVLGGINGDTIVSQGYVWSGNLARWRVVTTADLNQDGRPDLLLQNLDTGAVYYWLLDWSASVTISGQGSLWAGGDANWWAIAAPDLNGDGKPDLIFQYRGTGAVFYWTLDNLAITESGYLYSGSLPTWNLVTVTDLNNDGTPDLLFQNSGTGALYYWLLDSAHHITASDFLFSGNLTNWNVIEQK